MAHIRASFGDHGKDRHDDSPPPDTSDADAPPRHVD
jgi:hypothetical protein